tara:strand:- start:3250 stop:3456 length:207 start_codon:yes stop_codon:yes gene_type:complete
MKISELIEQLEDLKHDHGDLSVSIAIQPNYPLICGIARIRPNDGGIVIAAGEAHGYANSDVYGGEDNE